jgi:hypothetical protein
MEPEGERFRETGEDKPSASSFEEEEYGIRRVLGGGRA